MLVPAQIGMVLVGLLFAQPSVEAGIYGEVDASFFEGRWAFEEESCEQPSSWTMIAGGNFVSDDLMGSWEWTGERLTLNLIDLAIDEETGEAGGKFQMDGPVEIVDSNAFQMTIEPDVYKMKRCSN